jgi:hypothetical protein
MAERRDSAAALEMTAAFDSFISNGVPNAKPSANDQPEKGLQANQTKSVNKAPKQKSNVDKGQRKKRRRAEAQQDSPEFARTLSRARIQKSIRFLPQLIAQFEEHARKEEAAGRRPPSVQDAMNEALGLWLRRTR